MPLQTGPYPDVAGKLAVPLQNTVPAPMHWAPQLLQSDGGPCRDAPEPPAIPLPRRPPHRCGHGPMRKAKLKVAEKQEAIEGFDRAVRQSERELAAVVVRVKDEEVDEVVEVDVQGEMEEASVKEKEEETKVVEAAPARGGDEPVAQGG